MKKYYQAPHCESQALCRDPLQTLAHKLSTTGYSEYYSCFNPHAPRLEHWQLLRTTVPSQLGSVIDLFLLNKAVDSASLPNGLYELIDALMDLGLLVAEDGGQVRMPGLVILPVMGNWLICNRPQVNPTLYFGDDSIALLFRQTPQIGGRCLDLCSGPGIQALYAARFASSVTAIEINPVAADLNRLNVRMNGLTDRITVLQGDLFSPLSDCRFDTILANPPLLPFPKHIAYPFVGHGGSDGMNITWRILSGLPAHLNPEGMAQIIGTTLSDGLLPVIMDQLEEAISELSLDLLLTITSHQPLTSGMTFFDGLVTTACKTTGLAKEVVEADFNVLLKNRGATHLCACFFHARHGSGHVDVLDVSTDEQGSFWYV